MKKRILVLLLAVFMSLAAYSKGNQGASKDTPTLVVSNFAFKSDEWRALVYAPFEKKFNCKIIVDEGRSADRIAKLEQKPSEYDVIILPETYAAQAIKKNLFEEINYDKLSNLNGIYEFARRPMGGKCGPGTSYYKMRIVYNKAALSTPPGHWKDLWEGTYKKQLGLPDIIATEGPLMLCTIADMLGVSLLTDEDAVFNKWKALSPNIARYYSQTNQAVDMFNQGEMNLTAMIDLSIPTVLKASKNYAVYDPPEGSFGGMDVINISRASSNKELAMQFIDFMLSYDVQYALAVNKVKSMVRSDVVLSPEQAGDLTYGAEAANGVKMVDWLSMWDKYSKWIDRWNREIANN